MPSSTQPTVRCWAAAAWTGRSTAPPGRNYSRPAARSAAAPTGEARITYGYNLAATYVIHTVGPIWAGGRRGEADLLADAYRRSLELARDHDAATVAFPAISTGAYGFPLEHATRIAIGETLAFLGSNPLPETVTFVCFDIATHEVYECLLGELPA